MKNADQFDVLIVYSEGLAISASSRKQQDVAPFPLKSKRANYNNAYAYFLTTCAKNNLKAAFTTSADIIGAGRCESYWLFEDKQWTKIKNVCFSDVIFDKFSPINKKQELNREILFSSSTVKPFNDEYLFNLFFDKHKTYKKLENFAIPTVTIENGSREGIEQACNALKALLIKHPHQNDFSQMIVIKDRFGAGGNNVYKFGTDIKKKIYDTMQKNKNISFILQPFAKFDKGYSYKNLIGFTDIRLIYKGRKLIQTYIRIAKKTDFRCNTDQGGIVAYITKKDIPKKVMESSLDILRILDKKNSLFALDFIVSNNKNVYLLEGNTGPGLHWDLSMKKDEIMTKRLIQIIVKELVKRVTAGIPDMFLPKSEILTIPLFHTV